MRTKMEIAEREDKLLTDLLGIIRFTEAVSAKLHRVLDEAKIYQVVKEEFAKSERWTASILLLADDGESLQLAETSIAPSRLEVLEKASGLRAKGYKINLKRSSIYSQVVKEGKSVQANVSDIIREFLPRPLAYLISKTMGYDKKFSILTPLHKHGKVGGVLAVSCADSCEYFTHSVENLALHISTALELAHKHAQRNRALQALKGYQDHLGELVEERTGELKTVNEKLREEITERKVKEKDYQNIIHTTTDGFWIVDSKGRFLDVNDAYCALTGYSREELLNMSIPDIEAVEKPEETGRRIRKIMETGHDRFETRHRCKDGRIVDIEISTTYAGAGDGRFFVFARDITERKRMEKELRQAEEQFRVLVEESPLGLSVITKNGRYQYVNPKFVKMLGYTLKDIPTGREWLTKAYPDPEYRKQVISAWNTDVKASARGEARQRTFNVICKDGSGKVILFRPVTMETGDHLLIYEDITDRKQAEEALRESREKFQKMFESVTDGISVVDLKSVIIEANQRAVEMHGFTSKDELLGRNASEIVAPRDRERIAANMRKAIKEGAIRGVEYTLLKADGSEFLGELSTNVLRDASGRVVAHITIVRDITVRKRMEEALQAEKNKLQSVINAMGDSLSIRDTDYNLIYQNEPLKRIYGDHLGEKCYRVYEGREEVCEGCPAEKAFRDGKSHTAERRVVTPSGKVTFWENTANPIRDARGEIVACLEIGRNITERKQAEEALQAEKNKLQSLIDAMEYGLTIQDRGYNIIYQGEQQMTIHGDHVGEKCYRVYEGREEVCDGCPVGKAFRDGKSHTVERKTVAPSGEVTIWENTANPIRDAGGRIVSCLEVSRNITDRKQAEEALRESQAFSSSLLEGSPTPIFVINPDTSVRYVNPAFKKLTGFTLAEIAGKKAPHPWWPEGKRERILAALKDAIEHGGRRTGTERMFQKKNGEHFWVTLSSAPVMQDGKPIYLVVSWLDITERKRAEEKGKQLQQELYLAQRLAAVGELAAGVAHEINNPLTGVLGFSQRLMRKSTDKEVSRDLEIIHDEARRAADVVQNLLTFARRRQPKKEYTSINDIVQRTLELRSYALQTSNIEVVTAPAHSLPQVMVDFPQMQEVFLNIILNAEQAMGEAHGRGKLVIKTRRLKDHVRISFADDGPGISPENLVKVFDPFFTTREQKGGTGLGLSACHGIVTEHSGRIYVRSKPGQGATFIVELPLSPVETTVVSQS